MSSSSVELLPPPGPSVYSAPVSSPFNHPSVAPLFLSALSIRVPVFVDEQHCGAAVEIDDDDPRSWHWVAFISNDKSSDHPDGKAAAATIRLIPPAPIAGHIDTEASDSEKTVGKAVRPKHGATAMWDGREPFVKLGRMATLKAYRKLGLGRLLVDAALEWLEWNKDQVNGAMDAQVGLEGGDGDREREVGEWNGLVLVHAQKEIERFWAALGFVKDEGMGEWWEDGIEHVAVWKRVRLRIFNSEHLKSKPSQVFALVVEATKWSEILSEVIQKTELLRQERKLSPSLALLLVHDLLVSKKGIAAPVSHPLRVAATKHKARLNAELTKARLKRGFTSLADLKTYINEGNSSCARSIKDRDSLAVEEAYPSGEWPHPRWVRVNTLRTSTKEQLDTAFVNYQQVGSIEKLLTTSKGTEKFLHLDKHVPDLIACSPTENLLHTAAYRQGLIILQDKASCFPAYLLGPAATGRDCLDACAAPGNKTTHMAAIKGTHGAKGTGRIYACEKDRPRAKTLQSMVTLAGADNIVVVKAGQDFLRLDPIDPQWNNVGSILLDPSCSGSGIIGRDEELAVTLPKIKGIFSSKPSRKRKRKTTSPQSTKQSNQSEVRKEQQLKETAYIEKETSKESAARLEALSRFQLKLLLHAFRFPLTTRVAYSTCSIHPQENEQVVINALLSPTATEQGWRILRRDEQVSGMAAWHVRGDRRACGEILSASQGSRDGVVAEEVASACIRCEKGTKEGTQGFFVAAFVREERKIASAAVSAQISSGVLEIDGSDEDEWEGFNN
ncbi:MAG: hypothetical protein Q9195_009295 [Heterodermia aff. obscurata]